MENRVRPHQTARNGKSYYFFFKRSKILSCQARVFITNAMPDAVVMGPKTRLAGQMTIAKSAHVARGI